MSTKSIARDIRGRHIELPAGGWFTASVAWGREDTVCIYRALAKPGERPVLVMHNFDPHLCIEFIKTFNTFKKFGIKCRKWPTK